MLMNSKSINHFKYLFLNDTLDPMEDAKFEPLILINYSFKKSLEEEQRTMISANIKRIEINYTLSVK